ncbi:NAD(P)/FAD-dependent oxidoreductase [Oceanobacillus jeddahense]|uniref:NAD(P)/FAD-dependent oxidoreductase n=1 Tax=Oceanobacillus jeddahense TaxID=1462527 RepID=UPI000595FB72|nr:NAD(P)/FAD-dependent oxidoreductase [Oceanobacillus jeddahense]
MLYDCAVIGGGPAGLNAALILGRGRKEVILFDDDTPRNAVTRESHNFITRDGIHPAEFKKAAYEDLNKYPTISVQRNQVVDIVQTASYFQIQTEIGQVFEAQRIVLATGLKDILPEIEGIHQFYGKSLFGCPYCDGWELKDLPLVYIAAYPHAFNSVKMVSNWSKDIVVCTNGQASISPQAKTILSQKNIPVVEDEILRLQGEDGQLKSIQFKNGKELSREAGFISHKLQQASPFAGRLELESNGMGGIRIDPYGRTSRKGVYAAGDCAGGMPQQIVAAAEGSKAAVSVLSDYVAENF